jgi:(R,R)-butanediol dehydrogenase / meso-butanediol dehydrogenase / diacetyl reductase
MLAATYMGDRAFAIAEHEPVQPAPGEVRVDVAYVGICGTDLHIRHGAMDKRVEIPGVIGHEMSGRIAAVGPAVEGWNVGDPVTVMPLVWCGACPACRAGNQHVCQNLVFVGIDSPGAMQQSWTVPAHLLVPLPDGLRLDHAALAEPVAVAVHDVRRAGVREGETALVVGGGPIGVLIALVLRAEGADVLTSEPNAGRRAVASGLGLRAIDPLDRAVEACVEDWTGGAGADVAFEVSGSQPGLSAATSSLRVRGRLVVVAIHPEAQPLDLFRFFWRELTLMGARVYEREDFERAVELVAAGSIPADALISRIEPLRRTPEAFDALESGGDVMKVLIDCAAR